MKYFNDDFSQFFIELGANNNKEWFHANKKRYEKSVKKPFTAFISDVIQAIQKEDPTLNIEAKNCMLRINRDIRFSKDKTPYNPYYTAFISNGGRKDKSIPGLFLRLSPEQIGMMGGCFQPSKEQLAGIRAAISQDISGFQKIVNAPKFVKTFGSLKGEAYKRIPKELKEIATQEPLIMQKQFYFMVELSPNLITSETLLAEIMGLWHTARPMNDFLTQAISK